MLFFGPDALRATGSTLPCLFLPMTGNLTWNIKECRCLFLLMTGNPLKNIKGCQCLFLLRTGNFIKISGTKFFRYRFCNFFPVLNSSDTGSKTFFRYQIFPIPVPRLFSGTNFFWYRFRHHQKYEKFPIPGIPGTGTSNSASSYFGLLQGILRYIDVLLGTFLGTFFGILNDPWLLE